MAVFIVYSCQNDNKVTMVTNLEAAVINIESCVEAISSLSLFKCFTKNELPEIFNASQYKIKEYKKGQTIHLQNELCYAMDIILSGRIAVQKLDENGNVLTISVFSQMDIIGANLIFSSRNAYPMTVVCEADAVVLHIYEALILKLCNSNSCFMVELLREISDRTLVLTDKINAISLKTIRQRIVDFLVFEYHLQKNMVIKLNISKKDLAERFGVQRTSLSRELNKMRKDGIIDFKADSISIKNLDLD